MRQLSATLVPSHQLCIEHCNHSVKSCSATTIMRVYTVDPGRKFSRIKMDNNDTDAERLFSERQIEKFENLFQVKSYSKTGI